MSDEIKQDEILKDILKGNEIMASFMKIHAELVKFKWDDQAKLMNLLAEYFDIRLKDERFKSSYRSLHWIS